MAKLFAITKIIMPGGDLVPAKAVFDATPEQAKQFDKLQAARPATQKEIRDAELAIAEANGTEFAQPELPIDTKIPPSGAAGDPHGAPKAKSA